MSDDINVFVDSNESVEDFGQQIEPILGIKLERDMTKLGLNSSFYIYSYAEMERHWFGFLRVPKGFFLNDRDMLFETYNYRIQIHVFGDDPIETAERQRELGLTVFDRLKATGQYRLLMTHNVI